MTLPGQDALTKKVLINSGTSILLQDPSRFEMAHSLIEKFAITAFPFTPGGISMKKKWQMRMYNT